MSHVEERNHDNTVFVGSLDQSVDEALLWELMIQVGPVGAFTNRLHCECSFPLLFVLLWPSVSLGVLLTLVSLLLPDFCG